MMKNMCVEAGIHRKTNHSLHASSVTTLFQKNMSERVIQNITGHRSLEALRTYENFSLEQHRNVSKLLMRVHQLKQM